MLSDEKMDRKIREHVKEHPVILPEDYLWSAILELQENVRVVMVLYYYDGFSVREISAMLDIPEGTTKTRLSAGRKQLTKWLENGKER